MIKKILFFVLIFSLIYSIKAQNGRVGVNILYPDSSAVLQLEATDKGFALPRLTTTQMEAISNPMNSLMVYNTEDSLVHYWNGSCWLKAYQKNCYECEFSMSISAATVHINHLPLDSVAVDISVLQTNGNQLITLIPMAILPSEVSMSITNNLIDSFGVATLSMYGDIFAPSGNYPIIIQAICGDKVQFVTVNLILDPCIYVPIAGNEVDLDLQVFGSLPGPGTPVCVIADVYDNIEINASSTANAAFYVGNLDANSHVGIINNGSILGRGGDGGSAGNILSGSFGEDGFNGGNALELTTKTSFNLNGEIYGGGGGGAGIGTGLSFNIFSTTVFVGFGYGGGGGVANGLGGGASSGGGLVIGELIPGTDATGGVLAVPGIGSGIGSGFDLAALLGIPLLYADLTGNLEGGDGGNYAEAGEDSNATLGIDIGISTFFGNISIYSGSFPVGASTGGLPGMAVKTNGNTTVNLVTPNLYIKGVVAP